MIQGSVTVLAGCAYALSVALTGQHNRPDRSCPRLVYDPQALATWAASCAAKPMTGRGRTVVATGDSAAQALGRLVEVLRSECLARGLDDQQILRDAKLADYV